MNFDYLDKEKKKEECIILGNLKKKTLRSDDWNYKFQDEIKYKNK